MLKAYKDPRVTWHARTFAAVVVAYAFSPIDLIPDPIPVFGHPDDPVIIPPGVALAIRMIPLQILSQCREKARGVKDRPVGRVATVVVVAVWISPRGVGRMARGAGVLRTLGEAGCVCYDLTAD